MNTEVDKTLFLKVKEQTVQTTAAYYKDCPWIASSGISVKTRLVVSVIELVPKMISAAITFGEKKKNPKKQQPWLMC